MAVTLNDQSANGSAATGVFQPVFGSIALPKDQTMMIAAVAGAVLIGIIIWKKL